MFWNNHPSSPQIDTALVKEELTLTELLDQENVLQELKSENTKLIDFITRDDIMAQLVSLVTEEPSPDLDERERYRRPNLACEVLTTDILILNERLSEKPLLSKLCSFLESEPPLNPLLASFFSRTLSMLICRKTDRNWYSYQFTCLRVFDFLKSYDNSLGLLLKHLGTSAIMDLTLKLITQVEGDEMQRNILDWLENEGLVGSLISLFDPSVDSDRHYNAAQLLCDTIRKCREDVTSMDHREIDPILNAIQSPVMIEKLLDHMLGGDLSESSIVGGISVLLTLLESTPSLTGSGDPSNAISPQLISIVSAIVPHLPKLHELLINPPKKTVVKLACGTLDPALGITRLSVVKLLAALIATNILEVNSTLDELNTVQVLLDLFFHYTWNNFLHTQIEKCLAFAINSPEDVRNNPLISNIFIKCRLLQRILEAWEENETEQSKGGKRRGYMGHLTNVANAVVKQSDGNLGDFLNQNMDPDTMISWHHYVETALTSINEIQKICLGGIHPSLAEKKDEGVYKDIPFSDDPNPQQLYFQNYPDFQEKMQDYMGHCRFTSNEPYINAQDEADLRKAREEVFKEMCSEIKQMGPDVFSFGQSVENKVWEETPESVWNSSDDIGSKNCDEEDKDSGDNVGQGVFNIRQNTEDEVWEELTDDVWNSSDDIGTKNTNDKDAGGNTDEGYSDIDLWSNVGVGTPVVDPGNPWKTENISQPNDNNEGWADFTSHFSEAIEQQFQAVQLSGETTPHQSQPARDETLNQDVPTHEDEKTESSVVVEGTESACGEEPEKNDNNSKLNSIMQEDDALHEEELIDNFRFLSKKGMITDDNELPKQELEQDARSKILAEEDKPAIASTQIPESETLPNEVVKKDEVPGDPV